MGLNERYFGVWEKKGIFFTGDALVALFIILIVVFSFYPLYESSKVDTRIHEDLIVIMSNLKVGESNSTYVKSLIDSGEISNVDNSIMDQIGEFYLTDISLARSLAQDVLDSVETNRNIGIWYNGTLIASKNSTAFQDATNIQVARQIISGIQKGVATGFVSKAWLKKIEGKETTFVLKGDLMCGRWGILQSGGEYCGAGSTTINYKFEIPKNSTILEAYWLAEPTWTGQPTELWINGNKIYDSDIQYFVILNITSFIVEGNNTAILDSNTGGDDGASHIVIRYKTEDLQTYSKKEKFDFNEMTARSLLYHEKALFIPSEVISMEVILNTTSNVNLSIRRNAQIINIGVKSPINGIVNYTPSEIASALSSHGISYSELNDKYFYVVAKVGVGQSGDVSVGSSSYIYVASEDPDVPFGSIDISKEILINETYNRLQSSFYENLVWRFSLPNQAMPLYADWQLGWLDTGGGGAYGQEATANGIYLYQSPPDPFIQAFNRFGYSPSVTNGLFLPGSNNFTLDFGSNYGVSNESSFGVLLYFLRSFVNFGDTKTKAQGGNRTIIFQDDTIEEISLGNSSDLWDPNSDAIDDAIDRLLLQFDSEGDGKIDIFLSQNSFGLDTLDVAGVPLLWSAEVQVRSWR